MILFQYTKRNLQLLTMEFLKLYEIRVFIFPQNTHEKKFWTHKRPTRKNFGFKKNPREKILDPQKTREKKFWT